ncbi:UNVERIFIED_CONTAM: PEP-carboxykinase I [Hammondia hammondi]|eukprot:XP_008889136.1 PEP-carboxykinase I [Hammondia hammondi]
MNYTMHLSRNFLREVYRFLPGRGFLPAQGSTASRVRHSLADKDFPCCSRSETCGLRIPEVRHTFLCPLRGSSGVNRKSSDAQKQFGVQFSRSVRKMNRTQSSGSLKDSISFLEMLKKQIDANLQHHKPGDCPLTKKDILDLGQLQKEIDFQENVQAVGITCAQLFHNTAPSVLYEQALKKEAGSLIASSGALCVSSGLKTGRSPADKRIVEEPSSRDDVWWGKVNIPFCEKSYLVNRERAVDYLNLQDQLYIVDAFAGWDPEYRIKIRVITTRAYHALFMQNMLVMPTAEELENFRPDFTIYNAGCFPANRFTNGVTSQTSVAMNLGAGEMVILGTQYAGEMKKGILTLMMYLMPKRGQLPLHSSCNVGPKGDVTLFFGLSGTGKTTLSADPSRQLIGDDEHVWTDKGVFNIEGGCYAKCKDLSKEQEPEIWNAIRFGSVLENVIIDGTTRVVDFRDVSITENTRCAYPLSFIPNALLPAKVDTHPSNIILLTCDAFGVLPPLSKLTPDQVMYHFISGYTSKMAGTEIGILEPTATFSACYGAPFLAMHPMVYAEMLAKKLKEHNAHAWLLNTGWICGGYGMNEGRRIPLKYTRLMVDAIHNGAALQTEYQTMPVFNLAVPTAINGVPSDLLLPQTCWADQNKLDKQMRKLASLFVENFSNYTDRATPNVVAAGPVF